MLCLVFDETTWVLWDYETWDFSLETIFKFEFDTMFAQTKSSIILLHSFATKVLIQDSCISLLTLKGNNFRNFRQLFEVLVGTVASTYYATLFLVILTPSHTHHSKKMCFCCVENRDCEPEPMPEPAWAKCSLTLTLILARLQAHGRNTFHAHNHWFKIFDIDPASCPVFLCPRAFNVICGRFLINLDVF